MSNRLIIIPIAQQEITEVYDWYDDRAPHRAQQWLVEVAAALRRVTSNPLAYQPVHRGIRRVPVRFFPHHLFYAIQGDLIRVIACLHSNRDPQMWKDRT